MNVRIALVQTAASLQPDENCRKAVRLVDQAARAGAKIVCLQELFAYPYFPQSTDQHGFTYAETIPGPSTRLLQRIAKRRKIYVVVPIFEKRAPGVYYNASVVLGPKGMLGHYRKLHIPQDAHSFSEKFFFAPGDLGYLVVPTPFCKIGVLICWDQWYPEAARACALKGAQILFYPTAIGWHKTELPDVARDQREAWVVMHRAHAIANGIFVAAPNRVGVEGNLRFWGSSLVVEPSGHVISLGSQDKEEAVIADCNLKKIEEQRHAWPFLRDRRVDMYQSLLTRFEG